MKCFFSLAVLLIIFKDSKSSNTKICKYEDVTRSCLIDNFDSFTNMIISCSGVPLVHRMILMPSKRLIFDFGFQFNECSLYSLNLNNFGGILIDFELVADVHFSKTSIYNSDFIFIFNSTKKRPSKQSFFNKNFSEEITFFTDVRYYLNTPKLAFQNASVSQLTFIDLSNSSIKVNYFTFERDSDNISLNSQISDLTLNLFKVRLCKEIIDKDVFERIKHLYLYNYLLDIETETFGTFKHLESIQFSLYTLKKFFHQGIEWMKSLNQARFNLTTEFDSSTELYLKFEQIGFDDSLIQIEDYFFPNEDICLFESFPHEQKVFPIFYNCKASCTYIWITQFYSNFPKMKDDIYFKRCSAFFKTYLCDFKALFDTCHINDSLKRPIAEIDKEVDYYLFTDKLYKLKKYDFILSIIILPIVCIIGMFFNILCILVLSKNNFIKANKDRMYKQMLANSLINFFICLIYLIRFLIKCIDSVNNFCFISIISNTFLRYFLIVLVYFFGSAMRTWSNVIQLSIALDRFILSSDTKNKYFRKFSQIDLRLFFSFTFVLCLITNSINLFEYKYERNYESVTFPIISFQFFNFDLIYSYFNILNLLFSNFILLFLQLIVDIGLLAFVKTSIRKKNNILKRNKNDRKTNIIKDGKNYEKKIKIMIILSGLMHSMLHSPDLCVAIFMATTDYNINEKRFYRIGIQYLENNSLFINLLSVLSDIIYISSYSLNFFLFYNFNALFHKSFKTLFFEKKSTKKN